MLKIKEKEDNTGLNVGSLYSDIKTIQLSCPIFCFHFISIYIIYIFILCFLFQSVDICHLCSEGQLAPSEGDRLSNRIIGRDFGKPYCNLIGEAFSLT